MKSTFRTLFYLRKNRLSAKGTAPIMVRVTINGEIAQFNSKLEVNPTIWDIKLGRAKGKTNEAININRSLNKLDSKIENIYNKLLDKDGYVFPESVKNMLLGTNTERKLFLDYFDMHNQQYKLRVGKTTTHTTYRRYELVKEKLQLFLKKQYNLSNIMAQEIDTFLIESFYLYLRDDLCNNNTAMKFIQRFRGVFNYAVNLGVHVNTNPFVNFKFHYDEVEREILTLDEINSIYSKKFASNRLSQVRDIFIFCCFTGLAYIDVLNLIESNIKESFDGDLWIMTKRSKTGVKVNVRLLDIPKQIIDKYQGQQKNGKVLPVITNQKMNDYLKEIAALCNIDKTLTFHRARHSNSYFHLRTSNLQA